MLAGTNKLFTNYATLTWGRFERLEHILNHVLPRRRRLEHAYQGSIHSVCAQGNDIVCKGIIVLQIEGDVEHTWQPSAPASHAFSGTTRYERRAHGWLDFPGDTISSFFCQCG